MRIDPSKQTYQENYKLMIGSIVPRPIAFVSTLAADGTPNLGFIARWLRDPATGNWYHLATMRIPFAATGINGLSGFQEDFGHGNRNPRRTDYRNVYYHKFRHACKNADAIVAVSRQTKADIGYYFNIPEEKMHVIYQTCDARFTSINDESELVKFRADAGLPAPDQ